MERLSVQQLCQGINAARRNAAALLEDARILQGHGRHARAFAMAYAAGEELGKVPLLFGAAARIQLGHRVDWHRVRKSYASHSYKAENFTFSDVYRLVAEREGRQLTMDEAAQLNKVTRAMSPELPKARMEALYSDYSAGKFVEPSEIIRPHDAKFIMTAVAAELADCDAAFGATDEEAFARITDPEGLERLRTVYEHDRSVRDG